MHNFILINIPTGIRLQILPLPVYKVVQTSEKKVPQTDEINYVSLYLKYTVTELDIFQTSVTTNRLKGGESGSQKLVR